MNMNAIQTEAAMHDLLIRVGRNTDPNYISIKNLLISYMYNTCISKSKIYEIFVEFCNTGVLPAMSTVPGYYRYNK
nr:MAG TPA: hypothetical protein [Caudoviricetes sp.]